MYLFIAYFPASKFLAALDNVDVGFRFLETVVRCNNYYSPVKSNKHHIWGLQWEGPWFEYRKLRVQSLTQCIKFSSLFYHFALHVSGCHTVHHQKATCTVWQLVLVSFNPLTSNDL
jgi:hypothetical protein